MFKAIYGSPWLAAPSAGAPIGSGARGEGATWEYEELKRLKRLMAESHMEVGNSARRLVRIALYVAREERCSTSGRTTSPAA